MNSLLTRTSPLARRFFVQALALLAVFVGTSIQDVHAKKPVDTTTTDIIGTWEGTFESDDDETFTGTVSLEITEVRQRRLEGVISMLSSVLTDLPILDAEDGTGKIAASGQFGFQARSADGKVIINGRLNGDTMTLKYVLQSDEGTDHGTIELARVVVVPPPVVP